QRTAARPRCARVLRFPNAAVVAADEDVIAGTGIDAEADDGYRRFEAGERARQKVEAREVFAVVVPDVVVAERRGRDPIELLAVERGHCGPRAARVGRE